MSVTTTVLNELSTAVVETTTTLKPALESAVLKVAKAVLGPNRPPLIPPKAIPVSLPGFTGNVPNPLKPPVCTPVVNPLPVGIESDNVDDSEWDTIDLLLLVVAPVVGTIVLAVLGLFWNLVAEAVLHHGYGRRTRVNGGRTAANGSETVTLREAVLPPLAVNIT